MSTLQWSDSLIAAARIAPEQISAVTLQSPPAPAGHYVLSRWPYESCFPTLEKPNVVHRFFMRVLLGLRWRSA